MYVTPNLRPTARIKDVSSYASTYIRHGGLVIAGTDGLERALSGRNPRQVKYACVHALANNAAG